MFFFLSCKKSRSLTFSLHFFSALFLSFLDTLENERETERERESFLSSFGEGRGGIIRCALSLLVSLSRVVTRIVRIGENVFQGKEEKKRPPPRRARALSWSKLRRHVGSDCGGWLFASLVDTRVDARHAPEGTGHARVRTLQLAEAPVDGNTDG